MVAAVGVSIPLGRMSVAIRTPAPSIQATMYRGMAAIGYPALSVSATFGNIEVALLRNKLVTSTAARAAVAARGRVSSPRLRTWTFTLDGHDFYVIRLGDSKTLVFDASTEQWSQWASTNLSFWRANKGVNWQGATGLANAYGSDVVVGDDTFGLLWFLDPDQGFDEHPYYNNIDQQLPFERIVIGQITMRGRATVAANEAYLTGDNSGLTVTSFTPSVTLLTSDDAGKSYVNQGNIPVSLGDYQQEYCWRSIGRVVAPGRLFKIVDNGAFSRIDGLDVT